MNEGNQDDLNRQRSWKIGGHRKLVPRILPLVVFGALWYMLVAVLSQNWAVNAQYGFGWFVPAICAYLLLIRWRTRPSPKPGQARIARWIYCTAAFALLPTWLIEQPNPDWRLINWLLASEIVALTLCAIYCVGGRIWLKHFAFSVCFILLSVPWPDAVERFVIEGLTQAATLLTVAALHLFNIPAVQHGNLIEVEAGLVGVDEACSGIRSLQATFMVSLFLGELYRASRLRRVLLVILGALIAVSCNVGRMILLAGVVAKDGIDTISKWHDPFGFIFLAVCLFLIWALAGFISGPAPKLQLSKATVLIPLPRGLVYGLGAWVLLTLVGTEVWYRAHENQQKSHWTFAWPVDKEDFSDVTISERESELLACDGKRAAEWTNGDGSRWSAFFFTWAQGPPSSRILARMHRPENCLPAAGYKLSEDRGIISVKAKNLLIPFHFLNFEYAGEHAYVFFCLWEDRAKQIERPWIQDEWTRLAKLEAVLLGERNLGQQVLEIVVSGYGTAQEAEAQLRRQMEDLIRA